MLADPASIDEEFRKAWHFSRCGQRDTSLEEFNQEVVGWLPLLPEVALPQFTGQMLADVVTRKGATVGDLDGCGWRELKVLPVAWYDQLARILTVVEDTGVGPDGLLDAYIAMIPKSDGDATPLRQRPLSVLPIAIVYGPLLVWVSLGQRPLSVLPIYRIWASVWSATLAARVRLLISRLVLMFALPLTFYRRVRVVGSMYLPAALHGIEGSFLASACLRRLRSSAARVRLVLSRLVLIFALPLDFHGRVRGFSVYVFACCPARD